MKTIEFDYKEFTILVNVKDCEIHFQTFKDNKKIPNGTLLTSDFKNIEEFVLENAEEDVDDLSDILDRQSE